MLALLLVQIGSSMPIYGNFSQNYYYVELDSKKWILDQNFEGAIDESAELDNEEKKFSIFQAQRFISILAIRLHQNISIMGLDIQKYQGLSYNYLQKINNYLGLGAIKQHLMQLKLCLAQNGGYMKIGTFNEDEKKIQINYKNDDDNRLYFQSLTIKELKLNRIYSNIETEVDFTSSYVYFPSYLYQPLIKHFLCSGLLCPQRNDVDGLTCYINDYDNIDQFYEKFPKIYFEFVATSDFIWFPQDYFVTHDNNTYCFPVKRGINLIILGQPFMRNKEFIFGNNVLIVNYQNCSIETSIDTPTISLQMFQKIQIFPIGISLLSSTVLIYYILFKIKLRKKNVQLINPHFQ